MPHSARRARGRDGVCRPAGLRSTALLAPVCLDDAAHVADGRVNDLVGVGVRGRGRGRSRVRVRVRARVRVRVRVRVRWPRQ